MGTEAAMSRQRVGFRVVEGDLERFIEFDREASWPFVSEEAKRAMGYEEYGRRHRELVERLYASNIENKIFFAVDEEGRLLGAAWVGLRLDSVDYVPVGYLYDLEVAEHARGSGVGTALLAAVEDYCRSRGVTRLALSTPVSNTAALRWYLKRGFRVARVYLEKRL
jgi:GNAT superfamily N-acetyltransferase